MSLQGSLVLLQILPGFYQGQTGGLSGKTMAITFSTSVGTLKSGTDCSRSPSLTPALGYNTAFYLLLLLGRGKQFPRFALGSHSTC